MKINIIGSLAYDNIITSDMSFNEILDIELEHQIQGSFYIKTLKKEFGGCAGNIAYNLKILGLKSYIYTSVGDKDCSDYLTRLEELNIDTCNISIVKDEFTAQAHIINDLHNNQIVSFYAGALLNEIEVESIKVYNEDIIILSPENKVNILKFVNKFYNHSITLIFDPGQSLSTYTKEDLLFLLPKVTILILNDYELKSLLNIINLPFTYLLTNIQKIIITKGTKGVEVFKKRIKTKIKAYKINETIDPTGCGDAFRAGFIYGIYKDYSFIQSCIYGNAVASFVAETYGTQNHFFDFKQLKQRVNIIGENIGN